MRNRDKNKKFTPGTFIAIAVVLAFAAPDMFAVVLTLAIFAAIIAGPFLIVYLVKKKNPNKKPAADRPFTAQQSFPLDDCPKPFCFHKDKGEHHVRRGKEIDPWDRPDIDISKYQRRQ
ncbi:MAG: hypothetical protein J6J18_06710 [Oscillospiraceae bacterium]|nr:hypothetical protein [Oscillospiraceae bacterium]